MSVNSDITLELQKKEFFTIILKLQKIKKIYGDN